jgi:hypothetical protein
LRRAQPVLLGVQNDATLDLIKTFMISEYNGCNATSSVEANNL